MYRIQLKMFLTVRMQDLAGEFFWINISELLRLRFSAVRRSARSRQTRTPLHVLDHPHSYVPDLQTLGSIFLPPVIFGAFFVMRFD